MEVKSNTSCVLCSNIRAQYKCLICYNYDLCAVCHRKSKDLHEPNNHVWNHPMQLIKTGLDYSVCGSCQTTDFRGNRYKCMICRDYDFCSDCHRHRASTEHNALHPMECIEKDSSKGLFCDLCNKRNYLGNQFKCLICHNYYLCYDCHREVKTTNQSNNHMIDHPMQLIKDGIDIKANGAQIASSCSSCQVQDFRGYRYKCMVCRDFDRCLDCRQGNQPNQHSPSHPMQYIPSTLKSRNPLNTDVDRLPIETSANVTLDTLNIQESPSAKNITNTPPKVDHANTYTATSTKSNGREVTNNPSPETTNMTVCKTVGCELFANEDFNGYCYACLRNMCRQEAPEKRVALIPKQESLKNQAKKQEIQQKQVTTKEDVSSINKESVLTQNDHEKNTCLVCLERPYNTVLLPCGHVWLCYACATTLMFTTKTCPACRSNVNSVHRVYMGH